MNYKQCELHRGTEKLVSWIPDRFAVEGKYLRLGDDDGWKVVAVFDTEPEDCVKARERDYKRWALGRGLK